jgi:hypothetical protein
MIRVNRAHPLNRGRLSWWLPAPPWIGGTKLVDLFGTNHATIINAPPWTRGFSGVDAALHLDGHIATPRYAVADCPTLSAYTLACQVAFDSLYPPDSSNSNNSLLKNWGSSAVTGYFHWNMVSQGDAAPPGSIRCYANATGGVAAAVSSTALSAGVPYHLAVTCGGGSVRLFLNGVFDGSASYTGTLSSNASKIAFGTKFTDDQSTPSNIVIDNAMLAGTLGDVSLWDRALSDAEVARLFAESRTGYPGMLLRDRMDLELMAPPAFKSWYSPTYSGFLGTGAA